MVRRAQVAGNKTYAVPMNARTFAGSLLVWSLHLISPSDALACVCVGGIPTIDRQVANAPVVIAARVIAAEPLKDAAGQLTEHIAAIRVEVLEAIRGGKVTTRLRIWDQFAGSSCSLELTALPVGTFAIIALDPKQERLPEWWRLIGIKPEPGDYLFGTCQQHWRMFENEADLRRYVRGRWKLPS